jgi:Tol biopolymer transport system component/predicted Ser/Thr protein kinase
MTLAAGTRLGPYEIVAPLGAGGMGEVYRAKDPRLGREVAIKVLPASFSQDADRLKRFEQEARAASALNHPNIVTVHDIGSADGAAFIAMELVDGMSLRQMLSAGALPEKKMLEIATQIAEGLAKAHSAGIVHRDLKPENVVVSRDGFVKLLDFGLAKPFTAPSGQASGAPTIAAQETEPGTVLGTVGYMSPEQASGRPLDFRSDQFALGSILYEMATGKRAFQKPTGAETLSAIIREEPDPVERANPRAPAPFRWIVERCLAKDPEDRYAATRDLARDLKSVREHISEVASSTSGAAMAATIRPRSRRLAAAIGAAAFLAAGLIAGSLLQKRIGKVEPPSFHQLTFRRGEIQSARFAPDGQTVVYTAAWGGKPMEIFLRRLESPESRPSGLVDAELLAVSSSGDMAVSLNRKPVMAFIRTGRLASTSIAGGVTPREILDDVECADWAPNGKHLALVRNVSGRSRLEYPMGKPLYETAGWIGTPRISRSGDLVAFCDHPTPGDDGGSIAVVDRAGSKKTISGAFASVRGLAWSPGDREVWFTGAEVGGNRALHAASRAGGQRLLARVTGSLTLQDVAPDGRVLISDDRYRQGIISLAPGETKERDLSWLDYSSGRDLSVDGTLLLFDETGEGGGAGYSVYIRRTDGSPATRIGDGGAARLSPDGRWALAVAQSRAGSNSVHLAVYPTSVGESRHLPEEGLNVQGADWLPDGKTILFTANEPGRGARLYVRSLDGGKPRAISPEGYRSIRRGTSPDGKWVLATGPDGRNYRYPVAGGEPVAVPNVTAQDRLEGWTADGKSIFMHRRGELPARIYRLDVETGQTTLWKEVMPLESAGLGDVGGVMVTPDGRSYVFGTNWTLSDLYLVEGVK